MTIDKTNFNWVTPVQLKDKQGMVIGYLTLGTQKDQPDHKDYSVTDARGML